MTKHPTFPEPAQPVPPAGVANPVPSPGNDLGAIDFRSNPSAVASTHDAGGGVPVGPMPDRGIAWYDLPDESSTYDRMGQSAGPGRRT